MVDVAFEHWRYVFPDEELVRYGSPYFDTQTAGKALLASLSNGAARVTSHAANFDPKQILCANEAFPEAALADPLADLEVWDDWRTGIRSFPYAGRYSKLGIRRQETKTSATSSVGVIGEIMAGVYAQAGIAPWVLVRVIRHWPDFIFYIGGDRYAFVESKAFTGETGVRKSSWLQLPDKLLGECLVTAVQQLNSDPFVQVWGAFTHIEQISPLRLRVIFLELDAGDDHRSEKSKRVLPDAVIAGIAERVLRTSLFRLDERKLKSLEGRRRGIPREERRRFERALTQAAIQELEDILIDHAVKVAVLQSRQAVEQKIRGLVRKAYVAERIEGARLYGALEQARTGNMSRIRAVGTETIYVGSLDREAFAAISASWTSSWESANQPWKQIGEASLWRCGGAVFTIADTEFEGEKFR